MGLSTNTDQNSTVELPETRYKNALKERGLHFGAPAVDNTIRIPERLAASCRRMVALMLLMTSVLLVDIHTPYVRTYSADAYAWVTARLSLDSISPHKLHEFLVGQVRQVLTIEKETASSAPDEELEIMVEDAVEEALSTVPSDI